MIEVSKSVVSTIESLVSSLENVLSVSWPELSDSRTDRIFDQWDDAVLNEWGRKVDDAGGVLPKDGFKTFDTFVSSQ